MPKKKKKIKPIVQDPNDLVELQFEAGPDAPKVKEYSQDQIFEGKGKKTNKKKEKKKEAGKNI